MNFTKLIDKAKYFLLGVPLDEVALVSKFFHQEKVVGTMLDVGAHTGSACSPFVEKEWIVFAFEPNPKVSAVLLKKFENTPNVVTDSRVVAERDGEIIPFYTSTVSTGISSMSPFHKSHTKAFDVETISLGTFLKNKKIQTVDFLKIDTEGHDFFVLKGMDWSVIQPSIIVAEFEDIKSAPLGWVVKDMVAYLQEKGYKIITSEWHPIKEYGRRHDWYRFIFDGEPKVPGDKNWGNIIAIKPHLYERFVSMIKL